MHRYSAHLLLLSAALLCSCETVRTPQGGAESDTEPDLMERFAGGFSVKKGEDGAMTMVSDKRSSFEGRKYGGDTSAVDKKAYATNQVERKQFDGRDTKYATKSWDGVKAYDGGKDTPDFITRAKGLSNRNWADRDKTYATNQAKDLRNQTWSEGSKRLSFDNHKEIEDKRKNYRQPEIMDSHKAAAKTMQETREIIGRTN